MSYYSSVIARPKAAGFAGRYVHTAGEPDYIVSLLKRLYHGPFGRDLDAMQKFMVDEHPGGWSQLGEDPATATGWNNEHRHARNGFVCYCHGGRNAVHPLFTQYSDGPDVEWLYVLGNTGIEVSQVDWGNADKPEDLGDQPLKWRHHKHVSWGSSTAVRSGS